MNNIAERQNLPTQLQQLAAQRQRYSDAKTLLGMRIFFGTLLIVAWSVLVFVRNDLKPYSIWYGVFLALIDTFALDRWEKSIRADAAKIQEMFDCSVLNIPWNHIAIGNQPDHENIVAYEKRYHLKAVKDQPLTDWYSNEIQQLPVHVGRLIAQRTNCWWNASLQKRYAVWNFIGVLIVGLAVFCIGLAGKMTLQEFGIVILAPYFPAILFGLRQFKEYKEASDLAQELKSKAESLLEKAKKESVDSSSLIADSRALQDRIFDFRKRSPLIFDWYFRRHRSSLNDQMTQAVAAESSR